MTLTLKSLKDFIFSNPGLPDDALVLVATQDGLKQAHINIDEIAVQINNKLSGWTCYYGDCGNYGHSSEQEFLDSGIKIKTALILD